MRDTTGRRLVVYLVLTFGLSSIFYALIVTKGMGAYNGMLVLGLVLAYGAMSFWCWKRRAA